MDSAIVDILKTLGAHGISAAVTLDDSPGNPTGMRVVADVPYQDASGWGERTHVRIYPMAVSAAGSTEWLVCPAPYHMDRFPGRERGRQCITIEEVLGEVRSYAGSG